MLVSDTDIDIDTPFLRGIGARVYYITAYVQAISITEDKIKSNSFHKLSWRVCRNKLKTTYVNIISYFHKLYQTNFQVCMPIGKLK